MTLSIADDIGRLQIAMEDATRVGVRQRLGNLPATARSAESRFALCQSSGSERSVQPPDSRST